MAWKVDLCLKMKTRKLGKSGKYSTLKEFWKWEKRKCPGKEQGFNGRK
jgi:hypothetical protein